MPDADLTPGEIQRSLDRIECSLQAVTGTLDDLTVKVVSDFYHLRDHEQRLSRLEKLTAAVAAAIALAILAALLQLVI